MEAFLPIVIWTILTLVPLIPTYVLHRFLESSATFTNTSKGIKLGGAIAAYFVLLTTGAVMYHQLLKPVPLDQFQTLRQELVGTWTCSSIIRESTRSELEGKTYDGNTMLIVENKKKLHITGITGTLSWNADVVILDFDKMVFIFEVPINRISGTTFLRFYRDDSGITSMHGHWGITGNRGQGNLSCSRPKTD